MKHSRLTSLPASSVDCFRFFAIDSRSIDTATENIRMSSPDMVEMMPGILPEIIEEFRSTNRVSVIAGGLILSFFMK